jgi:hypothetical protein
MVILQLFRSGTIKHSQVTVPGLPYKMVGCSSGAMEPQPLYRLILMPILDPISDCCLTKASLSPSNSHFHFVIRHSIAGISLMWRLAVNNQ